MHALRAARTLKLVATLVVMAACEPGVPDSPDRSGGDPSPFAPEGSTFLHVRGNVSSATTGRPIRDAVVTLYEGQFEQTFVRTNPEGDFELKDFYLPFRECRNLRPRIEVTHPAFRSVSLNAQCGSGESGQHFPVQLQPRSTGDTEPAL